MSDTLITTVTARQIIDSRGNPTVEADVELAADYRACRRPMRSLYRRA